ncbi:MAG TPA: Trp biosynthesis-associated membrane protein [Mycobacteriales bacterium]|nr:Trp biosynthesis-associated membrane protein [Mycobacteriales bacterium]
MSRTADRSGLVTALLLVLLAGVALLVSTAGPWVTGLDRRPAPLPDTVLAIGAADAAPAVRALGLVVLAGVPALLATRAAGRMAVGVVLLTAAAGSAAAALGPALDPAAAAPDTATQVEATVRPLLAIAGALLAAVAGLLALVAGRSWPALGRRYEAPAPPPEAAPGPADDGAQVEGAAAWDALDRGSDPTTDPTAR